MSTTMEANNAILSKEEGVQERQNLNNDLLDEQVLLVKTLEEKQKQLVISEKKLMELNKINIQMNDQVLMAGIKLRTLKAEHENKQVPK